MGITDDQRRALDKIAGRFEAEARARRPEILQPAEGSVVEFRERIRAAALRLADHYCDRMLAEVRVATALVASGALGRKEAMDDLRERIAREMVLRLAAEHLQFGRWLHPEPSKHHEPVAGGRAKGKAPRKRREK